MKKLCCLKGNTGELLREARDSFEGPFTVNLQYVSSAFIANPTNFAMSVTVRGNSKQRRQQARQLERWFNEPPTPHLCSCGAPAAGCIGYQGDLPDG